MELLLAMLTASVGFMVPMVAVLAVRRWRSFLVALLVGTAVFAWLAADLEQARLTGTGALVGPALGGFMLVGFAAGAIAKFVMLLGRGRASQTDSSGD